MAQSYSQVILHIIFSTKNREPEISESVRPKLHAYLATVIKSISSEVYLIGGTADHVHIACNLPRTLNQGDFLKKIKTASSKWMKEQGIRGFYWQNGYGVFSVSKSQLSQLVEYIKHQKEHHRKKGFKEEYREFLIKYGIQFNEEYLWN